MDPSRNAIPIFVSPRDGSRPPPRVRAFAPRAARGAALCHLDLAVPSRLAPYERLNTRHSTCRRVFVPLCRRAVRTSVYKAPLLETMKKVKYPGPLTPHFTCCCRRASHRASSPSTPMHTLVPRVVLLLQTPRRFRHPALRWWRGGPSTEYPPQLAVSTIARQ